MTDEEKKNPDNWEKVIVKTNYMRAYEPGADVTQCDYEMAEIINRNPDWFEIVYKEPEPEIVKSNVIWIEDIRDVYYDIQHPIKMMQMKNAVLGTIKHGWRLVGFEDEKGNQMNTIIKGYTKFRDGGKNKNGWHYIRAKYAVWQREGE